MSHLSMQSCGSRGGFCLQSLHPSLNILHRPYQPLVDLLDFAVIPDGSEILAVEPGAQKAHMIMCLMAETCFFHGFPNFFLYKNVGDFINLHINVHSAKPFFSHVGPGTNQLVTSDVFL